MPDKAITAALFGAILAMPASAQVYSTPMCAPAHDVETVLREEFNVVPLIQFTLPNGVQSILLTNPDTGAWVHVIISGMNWCMVAEGQDSGWWTPTTF